MYVPYIMKRKLTEKKVEDIMKDEMSGYKMYKKLGYKGPAKDEKRHYNMFKKKYTKMEKAEKKCKCIIKNTCKKKKRK